MSHTKKIGLISLGCPKATVDSEGLITRIQTSGYQMAQSLEESDVALVNTCGFIDSTIQESLETIEECLVQKVQITATEDYDLIAKPA